MPNSILSSSGIILIWAMGSVASIGSSAIGQDDFLVTLRDGAILRTQINLGSVPWRRIDASGSVSSDQLRFDTVDELALACLPASRQLIEIRKHLADLQSDNYHVRNQAEAALVLSGGQFIEVLNAARENGNAEVRYRVGRVLKRLQSDAKRIDADFDMVTFASGEVISGDLEFETLQVDFRGKSIQLDRNKIFLITRVPSTDAAEKREWTTQAFSKPADRFYQSGDVQINFDVGRLNESFAKFEDIHKAYVFGGVHLRADCGADPATIVTAGFALDQARSRKNSAATMMFTRNNKKYLGAIQIDFCVPGLGNIPASVHRVGCYIGLVDHPRDFVLDAYSAGHQIVASAEALEKSAFVGVESAIPIAYVRVQPNRNLKLDPAEQDLNFVIDDLTFDSPQLDPSIAVEGQALLQVGDGSRLVCSSLEYDGESFIARNKTPLENDGSNAPLSFAPDEITSITFWLGKPATRAAALWGYLPDGSFLPLKVESETLASRDFDQWTIDRAELAGVSGSNTVVRFPLDEDLASKQTVVVLPAERWIVPGVEIGADGVSWDPTTAQLREPFHLENSSHTADATTKFALADSPSIWWQIPSNPDADLGWLQTVDGSKFTLNGSSKITLEKLESEAIVLARAGQTIRIPWSEIVAVRFPR